MKKIVGLIISFNGDKAKCSACNRQHTRSFICRDENNTKYYYGSGCLLKQEDLNKKTVINTLLLVNVHVSNLLGEIIRGSDIECKRSDAKNVDKKSE